MEMVWPCIRSTLTSTMAIMASATMTSKRVKPRDRSGRRCSECRMVFMNLHLKQKRLNFIGDAVGVRILHMDHRMIGIAFFKKADFGHTAAFSMILRVFHIKQPISVRQLKFILFFL